MISKIQENIQKDKYFNYKIYSIYFDSDNFELISNSLEKPIYKEKLRLRKYANSDSIFFEIKKKYKGLVNKRRIVTSKESVEKYLKNKIPIDNSHVFKEIDTMINKYNLKPKAFVYYDRLAYIGNTNDDLRITFDYNIKGRLNDISFNESNEDTVLSDKYIMEIKANNAIPLWLVKSLTELKIYPSSFSKYGTLYRKKEIK